MIKSRKASASKRSHKSEHSSVEEESEEKWAQKRKKKAGKFVRELQEITEKVQNNSSTLEECKTMFQELIVVKKFLCLPPSIMKASVEKGR